MKLTKNFSLDELTKSEVAQRFRIPNIPGPTEVDNLRRLAWLLEKVREVIGRPVMVTSAYRCIAVNEKVGSKSASQHVKGCAADFHIPGLTPRQVMDAIIAAKLPYDQLIHEFDSWVHISVTNKADGIPRKQALEIDNFGTRQYIPGTPPALKPEIMKPLKKSRTIKAATAVGATGGVGAIATTVAAVAPAVPVVHEVAAAAQEYPLGIIFALCLLLAAFAAYIIWRRIDDKRKSV